MLIKATIVTFIEIFAQLNPLDKLLFKKPSSLFVDTKMIKNQAAYFFYQSVIRTSLNSDFTIANFQVQSWLMHEINFLAISLVLNSLSRLFCHVSWLSFRAAVISVIERILEIIIMAIRLLYLVYWRS